MKHTRHHPSAQAPSSPPPLPPDTPLTVLWIIGGLLLSAVFAGTLWPASRLWGFHFLAYQSTTVQILLAAIAAGAAAFVIGQARRAAPSSFETALASPRMMALAVMICTGLFIVFTSKVSVLGDGQLWANNVEISAHKFTTTRAPLSLWLHVKVFQLLSPLTKITGERTTSLVSILCGLATLWSWMYLARFLRIGAVTALLLGFMWSGVALFFGYVEAYSVVVAVSSWMIVLAYISLRRGRFSWLPVVLGVAAPFTNYLAVVFLPVLAVYCYWGLRRRDPEPRFILIFGGLTLLAAAILYFALGWQRGTNVLLPLLPTPTQSGAVFTLRQIVDLLNSIAFTCGPLLALFALAFRAPRVNHNYTDRLLLLLLVLFPLVALIMHNPQIGMPRDWDISASLLVFVPILGLICWKELNLSQAARKWMLVLCTLWLVLLTTPAIGVQSSEEMTLNRFMHLLSLDPDRSESGWDYLSSHFLRRGKVDEWGRCNLELVQHSGNPRYQTNLTLFYAFKCQWPEARQHLQAALSTVLADSVTSDWEKQITDPTNLLQLSQKYAREFREQDAANALSLAAELAPYTVEPRARLLNQFVSMRNLTHAAEVAREISQRDSIQVVAAGNLLREMARNADAKQRVNTFLSLSLIAEAASDPPAALRNAQAALKALPTDTAAQNLVARLTLPKH